MATGGMTPLRDNLVYIGYGKQSAWHTPVAATGFWRWLDGSDASIEPKHAQEREGDTSPFVSLVYKTEQTGAVKIVEYLRPRTAGCALQAVLGSGSETYTAPTKATTLAANILAGATSFQSTADLGNTGTLACNFTPGVASQTYEVQTVDLTTKSGTGPYTYTLAAAAKFAYAHTSGDALTSGSTHALVRGLTSYDPFTLEVARGDGVNAPFQVVRFTDAVCTDVRITSAKGKPVQLEHTWYGAYELLKASNAVPVYEGNSVAGSTGGPMMHWNAAGTWTLDGATGGNAASIEQVVIDIKNATTANEFVSENINPDYFTLDNVDISAQAQVIFQSFSQYYETYFGSASPSSTARDSVLTGFGSLAATWSTDAINALAASLPNVAYTAAKVPFKLDGKPVRQALAMTAVKTPASNPIALTLTNSQNSAY